MPIMLNKIHKKRSFASMLCGILASSIHLSSGFFFPSSTVINSDDPLENTGPMDVEKQDIQFSVGGDNLKAEMYIPKAPDGGDADLFGFVLFMPGFGTSFTMYEDYLDHLASHGYLTVGLDFASGGITAESKHDVKAQQALDVIAEVQKMSNGVYATLPVIAAGHSQGGKIGFYAASIDTTDSIVGVIAMDPVNSGGPPCFISPDLCRNYPVAPNVESGQRGIMHQLSNDTGSIIFRSAPDMFTNPDEAFNAQYFYTGSDGQGLDAAPSPAWYYDFGAFGHIGYLPVLPSEEVQIVKRSMVAFLQQHIQGINREDYLTGDIVQSDIASGYLVDVESR